MWHASAGARVHVHTVRGLWKSRKERSYQFCRSLASSVVCVMMLLVILCPSVQGACSWSALDAADSACMGRMEHACCMGMAAWAAAADDGWHRQPDRKEIGVGALLALQSTPARGPAGSKTHPGV